MLEAIENNKRLVSAMQVFSVELDEKSIDNETYREIKDIFWSALSEYDCKID